MNNTFEKQAGISLFIFTILLVFTMMLHPAGGSIRHLIRITPVIVITHSVAILALPFGCMGFLGLTRKIGIENLWIGWLGIFISLATVVIFISGVTVNSLHGLRIFGLCVVSWVLIVAYRITWN